MKIVKKTLDLKFYEYSIFNSKNEYIIYIYTNYYYSVINLNKNNEIKLKYSQEIFLEKKFLENSNNSKKINFNYIFSKYLSQFNLCCFTKIKFSGKGYKIKKNSTNSLVLLFNRSHTTTIWYKNIILKKLKKYKMYIKYMYGDFSIGNTIFNVRPINIFTKKGLRKSRQILLKKKGKK